MQEIGPGNLRESPAWDQQGNRTAGGTFGYDITHYIDKHNNWNDCK